MNITDPIRRQARIYPDAIAVIRSSGTRISYRELDRTVDALAKWVADLGLVPGNTAGVSIASPYKFLVLSLALARLGVAGAPMNLPAAGFDVCFATGEVNARGSAKVVDLSDWWKGPPASADVPVIPCHRDGAAVCRIFPSSGTTGSPKHVAITHDMMMRRVLTRWVSMRLPADARQLCTIHAGTYYAFSNALRVLWIGGTLVLVRTPEQIVAAIESHRVNSLVIAPGTLQSVVASRPSDATLLPSLETVEVGGSRLPGRLYEMARMRLCANIVNSYGSTEAANVASASMSDLAGHPGAVGYVHPGVEVQAVDDDDLPVPPGVEGILRIRSDNCVSAYVGEPAISASVFKGGWFYPGDLGAVSRDGLLTVLSRASDLINSGGNKVSPQVIEEVLLSLPEIREVAAFGVPDALGITQIWAAIVPNGAVDVTALDALCRKQLRENAPKFVLQMGALPRNEAGKVVRDELVRLAATTGGRRA